MLDQTDSGDLDVIAEDRSALIVGSFDVKGAVFIIPVDAPIPSEIAEAEMPSGSLYKRISALDTADSDTFRFVPISGAELLALERAWRMLTVAKRVFVLADLPAARYDVLFTQAVRQIGIQKVDWVHVSEAIAAKVIRDQRTKDKTPWDAPMIDGISSPIRRGRAPISSTGRDASLPVPESDDEDQT